MRNKISFEPQVIEFVDVEGATEKLCHIQSESINLVIGDRLLERIEELTVVEYDINSLISLLPCITRADENISLVRHEDFYTIDVCPRARIVDTMSVYCLGGIPIGRGLGIDTYELVAKRLCTYTEKPIKRMPFNKFRGKEIWLRK